MELTILRGQGPLDGRIKTIKDGRWLRTRREWVEQYVAAKTIKLPDPEVIELPRPRGRRHAIQGINAQERRDGVRVSAITRRHELSRIAPARKFLVGAGAGVRPVRAGFGGTVHKDTDRGK